VDLTCLDCPTLVLVLLLVGMRHLSLLCDSYLLALLLAAMWVQQWEVHQTHSCSAGVCLFEAAYLVIAAAAVIPAASSVYNHADVAAFLLLLLLLPLLQSLLSR
jgi:hypothetical protein